MLVEKGTETDVSIPEEITFECLLFC